MTLAITDPAVRVEPLAPGFRTTLAYPEPLGQLHGLNAENTEVEHLGSDLSGAAIVQIWATNIQNPALTFWLFRHLFRQTCQINLSN